MILGEVFDAEIQFNNPHIITIPPTRDYSFVEWAGQVRDKPFSIILQQITLEALRSSIYKQDFNLPPLQHHWSLMNTWIQNIWDALYNPISLKQHDSGLIGVIHGHHRLRLLDAMDVNHLWVYIQSANVGRRCFPPQIQDLMKQNDRAPQRGSVRGVCEVCNEETRWRRVTLNRLSHIEMFCMKCGAENPYPYPGRL